MDKILNVDLFNPCANEACNCRSINEPVTIVNPQFLKLLWIEKSQNIISEFSADIYSQIKTTIEEDFPLAVRLHLVPYAYLEVCMFREKMQLAKLLQTAFSYHGGYGDIPGIASKLIDPDNQAHTKQPCNIGNVVNVCPLTFHPYLAGQIVQLFNTSYSDLPNIEYFLFPSNSMSIFNADLGLPGWIGLSNLYEFLRFNSGKGFVSAPMSALEAYRDEVLEKMMKEGYTGDVAVSSFTLNWITNGGNFQNYFDLDCQAHPCTGNNITTGYGVRGQFIPDDTVIVEQMSGTPGQTGRYLMSNYFTSSIGDNVAVEGKQASSGSSALSLSFFSLMFSLIPPSYLIITLAIFICSSLPHYS